MSETTIANRALNRLGARSINSISENSAEAFACIAAYAHARDELLRSHRWNFARKRSTLTRFQNPTGHEWLYKYALPADCLRVMEINEEDVWDMSSPLFELEGRDIFTDAPTLHLKYIARIENVDLFDVLFTRVLVLSLAADIAEKVTGSAQLAQQMLQEKESLASGNARKIDANESRSKHSTLPTAQRSGFIRARFSGQ
jgi:hypothetical protein